jgi:hypothetical protein
MRRSSSAPLTPSQSHYVLERLRRDRKVLASDVSRYLSELQGEIRQLEERLGFLRDLHQESPAPARRGRPGRRAGRKARPVSAAKPKKAVSRKTAQSRKLQGLYLSLIRQIDEDKRPAFKKIAQESGREEAIRKMRAALK